MSQHTGLGGNWASRADVFPCMDCLSAPWLCLLTFPLLRAPWWLVQACPSTQDTHSGPGDGSCSVTGETSQRGLEAVFHSSCQCWLVGARWQFRWPHWCSFVLSLQERREVVFRHLGFFSPFITFFLFLVIPYFHTEASWDHKTCIHTVDTKS